MPVLGSGPAAESVARHLGETIGSEPEPGKEYVVVADGDDGLRLAADMGDVGVSMVVAWDLPSRAVIPLAHRAPTLYLGLDGLDGIPNNVETLADAEWLSVIEEVWQG